MDKPAYLLIPAVGLVIAYALGSGKPASAATIPRAAGGKPPPPPPLQPRPVASNVDPDKPAGLSQAIWNDLKSEQDLTKPRGPAPSGGKLGFGDLHVNEQLRTQGKAMPAAQILGNYLKANGYAGSQNLTKNFQSASNSDAFAVGVYGKLAVDGKIGPQTAGALSIYTNDVIQPDPSLAKR